jgi:hypothetical protein
MFLKYSESWHINVNTVASMTGNGRNKLRTYKRFKYGVENYYKMLLPFNDRSAFAKFRCGMTPIILQTGRYENI